MAIQREILAQWAEAHGVMLSAAQYEQFDRYKDLMLSWNEKINLTAITQEPDFTVKHIIDSLTVLPWVGEAIDMADIGTGAGLPGIPVKLVRPGLRLTLLDSLRKRILFLQEAVDKLALQGVTCVHTRAEDWRKVKNDYDICTARAVARLDVLAGYALPLLKPGGLCLAMKGPAVTAELQTVDPVLKRLGGEVAEVRAVAVAAEINHTVVVIRKK